MSDRCRAITVKITVTVYWVSEAFFRGNGSFAAASKLGRRPVFSSADLFIFL
jgi:hypothetical protein